MGVAVAGFGGVAVAVDVVGALMFGAREVGSVVILKKITCHITAF